MHESYKKWLEDGKPKILCACGCSGEIVIKEYCKWRGIPKYINAGHSPNTGGDTKFKKGIHPLTQFKKGMIPHNKGERGKQIAWNKGLKGYKTGKDNCMYGKLPSPKTGIGAWHYYKSFCFRSSWEFEFAKFLDSINEPWDYECKTFELKVSTYTPDFYLPNKNLWIEIKGWWRPGYKEKFEAFKEQYPKEKIVLIMHKPPYTIEDYK